MTQSTFLRLVVDKLEKLGYSHPGLFNRFRKTFQGKEVAQSLNEDGMLDSDNFKIYCANNHDRKDRVRIDASIWSTPCSDLDLLLKYLPVPYIVGSEEHLKDIEEVRRWSTKRDELISDQSEEELLGFREVPYFLRNVRQKQFVEGKDYLTTEEELTHVYEGNKPKVKQEWTEEELPITTLRHGARFVRNDPAVHVWADWVMSDLSGENIRVDDRIFNYEYVDGSDFLFTRSIFIKSLYWEVAEAISKLSFRIKTLYDYPRPEQVAWDYDQPLIPQAFDRGSPEGHGDFTAMHSAIYIALAQVTRRVFDRLHVMENGKTVEHNIESLSQFGTHMREVAGVHTRHANLEIKDLAVAVANRYVDKRIEAVQQHGNTIK